jgi:hypothetical protein
LHNWVLLRTRRAPKAVGTTVPCDNRAGSRHRLATGRGRTNSVSLSAGPGQAVFGERDIDAPDARRRTDEITLRSPVYASSRGRWLLPRMTAGVLWMDRRPGLVRPMVHTRWLQGKLQPLVPVVRAPPPGFDSISRWILYLNSLDPSAKSKSSSFSFSLSRPACGLERKQNRALAVAAFLRTTTSSSLPSSPSTPPPPPPLFVFVAFVPPVVAAVDFFPRLPHPW